MFIDDINLSSTVGIEDLSSETELEVYPNPASELLNIKMAQPTAEKSMVIVTDITGREVNRIQLPPFSGEQNVTLQVSDWPAGIYQISFSNGRGKTVERFVKQ